MREATRTQRGGLPTSADLFVGPDGELAALSRMLVGARTRLVTLTGPSGVGKNRLAVACAVGLRPTAGCVEVFVDLAPLRDPARVIAELAQSLDVEPRSSTDLIGQLALAISGEDRLVVLDNCEHLLAAAPDVGQVFASCPRLLALIVQV